MKYIFLLPFIGLFVANAFASSLPVPFLNPLHTLKKGDANFTCHEPGNLNGGFGGVAKFTVRLSAIDQFGRYPISVKNVQIGNIDYQGNISNWMAPNLDMSSGGGSVMFNGTPYERIDFSAQYDGPIRTGETGAGVKVSFVVSQDLKTNVVFARYNETAVIQRAPSNCKRGAPDGCLDWDRVIFDEAYVCDYVSSTEGK